jgi:acetyl esterase/lipase
MKHQSLRLLALVSAAFLNGFAPTMTHAQDASADPSAAAAAPVTATNPATTNAAAAKPTPVPVPPTQEHVAYGSDPSQWLNFWKARSDKPTPLIFNIHGGGWVHGPIEPFSRADQNYLDHGISVVHITYRFTPKNPLPAPVMDAAHALQFVKSKAAEWNIDPDKVILTGFSAGGCTTLWLATHPDLADPTSSDPVLRQSTKVAGAIAGGAQSTIEPAKVQEWLGTNTLRHQMICCAGGFKNNDEMFRTLATNTTMAALYRDFSPINLISTNEPPILLEYAPVNEKTRDGIHSGVFGIKFKERATALGVTNCYLNISHDPSYPGYPGGTKAFINAALKGSYLP